MRRALGLLLLLFPACGISGEEGVEQETAQGADAIIGGQLARAYPEAVLVDTDRFVCSGALIAPRVVLTAGHCVKGPSRWTVTAPFAGGERVEVTRTWTDYTSSGDHVNPRSVDVALLVLAKPIDLPAYPSVAARPVGDRTRAVNVGRVHDGITSMSSLYVGREVLLQRGQPLGFPLAYSSPEVIQSGDSGGPTYVKSPEGRTIVAVGSGAAGGSQILARVDLVKDEIDRVVGESARD